LTQYQGSKGHSATSDGVVGDVEDYRMGTVCDGRCPNNMESGTIINNHRYKFKKVDQYEHAIIVVGLEL
jgi:hypothetical protein